MKTKQDHCRGWLLLHREQVVLVAPFNLQPGVGEFNRVIHARHWVANQATNLTKEEKRILSTMQKVGGWRIASDVQELIK